MTSIPLTEKPLAFIDCETTGLDPVAHEIIEIAIIKEWPDGRIHEWHTKVRPQVLRAAEPIALRVNGFADDPDQWDGAPEFADVAPLIAARLDGCLIIGHNVAFDLGFLKEALKKAGSKARIPHRKLDTYTLAYEHLAHKGLNSLSLDSVCTFLGISNEGNHTALVDARRCREVWHTLTAKAEPVVSAEETQAEVEPVVPPKENAA